MEEKELEKEVKSQIKEPEKWYYKQWSRISVVIGVLAGVLMWYFTLSFAYGFVTFFCTVAGLLMLNPTRCFKPSAPFILAGLITINILPSVEAKYSVAHTWVKGSLEFLFRQGIHDNLGIHLFLFVIILLFLSEYKEK